MTRSLPRAFRRSCWSELKPLPKPTRMMTEEIPHTMPNIVRKLRILLARKVEIVWRNVSRRFIASVVGVYKLAKNLIHFPFYDSLPLCHPERSEGSLCSRCCPQSLQLSGWKASRQENLIESH